MLSRFSKLGLPAVLLLGSCSPYAAKLNRAPLNESPAAYSAEKLIPDDAPRQQLEVRWWEAFGEPQLSAVVEEALANNRSLQAAWSRLAQVREAAVIAGAARYPQIDIGAGASRNRLADEKLELPDGSIADSTSYSNRFLVQSGLSFELDLWRRIASQERSAEFEAEAMQADVEQTGLLLAGTASELWFRAVEQRALLEILESQIELGQTLLELTELRFAVGRGSALDVLQQRQQLAATKAQLPLVERDLQVAKNQLAVLVGRPPSELDELVPTAGRLPELPALPELVTPLDLLDARPDLRAARLRMNASEYDIAAALADRFPRLTVGLSYDFSAADISSLFTREAGGMAANLLLPVVDGGRRRAEVRRQRARAEELWNSFAEEYLNALEDVESSIAREYWQGMLLERLAAQFKAARAALSESRSRYMNGLSDYIEVILAVQAAQAVERRIVSEKRELLVSRSRLYRALGGSWKQAVLQPGGLEDAPLPGDGGTVQ